MIYKKVKINCLRVNLNKSNIDLLNENHDTIESIFINMNDTTRIGETYNSIVFYYEDIQKILKLIKKDGYFEVVKNSYDFLKEKGLTFQELYFVENKTNIKHLLQVTYTDYTSGDYYTRTRNTLQNRVNAFIYESDAI
jgi:hypothetical protein